MGKGGGAWIGSVWLKTATTTGSCAHEKEQWCYTTFWEYVERETNGMHFLK
jgi:hypothetical protein